MRTIKLTEKQFKTLENLLDYEFDQELNYQENGDRDTELLEDYLDLYKAVMTPRGIVEVLVYEDLCQAKQKQIDYLKEQL